MGYTDAHGHPIPFGFDGNNVPSDYLAFAQRLDDLFTARTYAEISAFSGGDLFDRRFVYQSDTGALRPWKGLYEYKASTATWQPLIPRGSASYTPTFSFSGGGLTLGSGASMQGRYTRFGNWVYATFLCYLGASGFVNGSNFVQIAAPVPIADSGQQNSTEESTIVGFGETFDGTPTFHVHTLVIQDTTPSIVQPMVTGQTSTFMQATGLFTWNANSGATGVLLYETTEP